MSFQNPYRDNLSLAAKWEVAIKVLGTKWMLHPQSTYKPRWCSAKA